MLSLDDRNKSSITIEYDGIFCAGIAWEWMGSLISDEHFADLFLPTSC